MTNKEKSQKGIELLKDAVLSEIRDHPKGIRNADIARNLGIESEDHNGEQKNWLSKSIYYILLSEKKVCQHKPRGPFFPVK